MRGGSVPDPGLEPDPNRYFLDLLDPDPVPSLIFTDRDPALELAPDPGPSINKQKMKKSLVFHCFVTYL